MAYALNIKINTISSLKAYLVSNNTNEAKKAVIEDNKGFYVSVFDKDNNIIVEETYTEEDNYNYQEVEKKLDVEKIIKYLENKEKNDK
jgi:tRNA A37 threonylcarbamoyladenosine modification protein TsaB